jgi:hypothetical protein
MNAPSSEFRLAQFNALRDEVGQRSGHQHTLVGLTVTSVGTIAGFVLAEKADPVLLLLVPFICFGLGMLWYDHAINIDRIGAALGAIERELGASYEESVRKFERSRIPPRVFPLGMVLLVLFVATPAAALLLAAPSVLGATGWIKMIYSGIWLVEAGATLLELFVMARWAWPPRSEGAP